MRLLAVWLVCFAAYAATSARTRSDGSDYAGARAAPAAGRGVDRLRPRRRPDATSTRSATTREFDPRRARSPTAEPVSGRLREIEGIGPALLIAPAYAIGGPKGAELFLAAIAGARVRARRAAGAHGSCPSRGRAGAALRRALAAALGHGGAVAPELARRRAAGRRGAVRAVAARSTPGRRLRLAARRCSPRCRGSGPQFVVPALPVAVVLVRWALRAAPPVRRARRRRDDGRLARRSTRRSTTSCTAASRPYAARLGGGSPTGADSPADYVEPGAAPRHAVGRPAGRAAALGAGPRARVPRGLAAVALAPRAPRPRAAGASRRPSSRPACCSPCAPAPLLVAAFAAPSTTARGSRAGT